MPAKRVLIVGHGSIGQRHLRLAREILPDSEIMVLRHRASPEIPALANFCVSTIDEALAFKPDIAVIAGPAAQHVAIALPLANAGVHLLVEKPLDTTAAVAHSLRAAVCAKGVVCLVGYNLRFFSSLRTFRELVKSGRVGRVFSVRCEIGQYLPGWRPGSDYRSSVSASKALGGGALLELSHELDYLRWIFGELAWVKAAMGRQSDLAIDVEDSVHVILGFEPDLDGHRLMGTLSMDFIRHDTTRQCVAIGDAGTLRWNALSGTVDCFDAGADAWVTLVSATQQRDDSYRSEWLHFLDCVQGVASPLVSVDEGWKTLVVADAIRQASADGADVYLNRETMQ